MEDSTREMGWQSAERKRVIVQGPESAWGDGASLVFGWCSPEGMWGTVWDSQCPVPCLFV